ncbi:MAG: NUDIX hydrolase [Chitinophagaceae bacterium]|nr:NUDIX hydrolase [Chitinophagaceae bacterium]
MNWKTIASEYLFKDLWFTVRKDTCERPDGKIITPYYVYEFPDWVSALAITKEGKVILEKQYRHGIGETAYELPGGCVDPTDVSFEDAIARELLEETGYTFDSFTFLGKTSANPSTNNNWMHMFLAVGGIKTDMQQLDENEDIEVHLKTIEELKELIASNQIIQSMHVALCYHAFAKLEKLSLP